MGSFREIGKNKYELTVELGYRGDKRIRRYRTVYARNKTDAKKQLTLFEAEMASKKITDTKDIILNDYYPKWKENFAKTHYGPRTFNETCNIIENRILPAFGKVRIKKIEKMDVVLFFNDLKKNGNRLDGKKGKLSSSTLRNIHKALKRLMETAVEWELIEVNPCSDIPLPKVESKKGDVYSPKEVEKLFEMIRDEPYISQLIIQVAAVTGARAGEISALEAKHLNTKTNIITIEQAFVTTKEEGLVLKKTKTDRTRKVSIPEELMEAINKLRVLKNAQLLKVGELREWKGHTFLFSNDFGKPLRPDSISQWWYRFTERNTSLKKIRFHDLRHTSATLLITQGVHAKIIQERLGHSNISTTMDVYGHVLEEADQTAAEHFKSFFNNIS